MAATYGQDRFHRALGRYTRRYRFEHPGMEQFVSTLRDELGDAAAQQLEEGLFRKGWVDYLVADAASHRDDGAAGIFDRDGKRETVTRSGVAAETWRGSVLVMRHGSLVLPVDVAMWGRDGSRDTAHWDGRGDWIRLPYEGKSELARVMVDPELHVSADENFFNNALRLDALSDGHRTLERTTYLTELALQWLTP